MDRELKIVISTFLVFFIYGLTSFFSSGSFATPVFLNQLILLGIAVLFYVLNTSKKESYFLLIYVIVQAYSCLIDGFTVEFLSQKMNNNFLADLNEQYWFNYSFMVVFFTFWIVLIWKGVKVHELKAIGALQVALLVSVLVVFFISDFSWLRDVLFMSLVVTWIFSINKLAKSKHEAFTILSYQFLLLILLEGMEYLL